MTIDRIDHVGVYVTDMAAAVAHLQAVGFVITPPSGVLSASAVPGGETSPIGTTNRVAVLGPSFLEIVTTFDPAVEASGPEPWRVRPPGGAGRSGPCIIGFGTSDVAEVDSRWRARGIGTTGVVQFEAAMKAVTSGVSVADVAIVERATTPEGLVLAVEFPPGDRRNPADRAHANGAAAITGVYMTCDDDAVVRRYEHLLGATADTGPQGAVLHLPDADTDTRMHFGTAAQLTAHVPGIRTDASSPAIVAVAIGARDLDAVRHRVTHGGVDHVSLDDAVVVADPRSNLVLRFEELV